MTLSRNRLVWAIPALLLFSGACKKNATTTTTTSTDATTTTDGTATVTMVLTPDPATASVSTDGGFTWQGAFTATVTNTNTTPITINSITADLQQSSGGIVIKPLPDTDESFRFDVRAPFNRIDINGNMAIPFTFFYTLPNRGRESLVTITLAVTTDAGAAGSVASTVKIQ
ncbi:MAG: hypothetical protein ABI672_16390 [Vicinamibacteria bacterium]